MLVVGRTPVIAGAVLRSRPIGVLLMEDEAGPDEKILAVPVNKLKPFYEGVREYTDLPGVLLGEIEHFFTQYKTLEPGKWVKLHGWGDTAKAASLISEGIARAKG